MNFHELPKAIRAYYTQPEEWRARLAHTKDGQERYHISNSRLRFKHVWGAVYGTFMILYTNKLKSKGLVR